MSDKRILAKIKKLMAMVERGNPHESANAMKKVQALMAEHQLSSEDVALSGIDASKVKAANISERQPKWSLLLVSLVRHAFEAGLLVGLFLVGDVLGDAAIHLGQVVGPLELQGGIGVMQQGVHALFEKLGLRAI